ncbi:hypothetical protein NC653_006663 [Populus alba x Populus x berolinensis]|uniref:Phytocyanin domain-containing protein n=1 Tax=Populus alba x Populus x berolinensis TaxID=444605 RepID=A0AAD6RF75_9ROSI|nr:hypothetical protein NC653_006663 [Populus alba x Populus x berolinensis]
MATVYQIGNSAGWTSMGQVDYQDWVASKNFHGGDTLVFNYNNQFHNVKQLLTPTAPTQSLLKSLATSTSYVVTLVTAKQDKRLISWSLRQLQI